MHRSLRGTNGTGGFGCLGRDVCFCLVERRESSYTNKSTDQSRENLLLLQGGRRDCDAPRRAVSIICSCHWRVVDLTFQCPDFGAEELRIIGGFDIAGLTAMKARMEFSIAITQNIRSRHSAKIMPLQSWVSRL